MPRPLRSVKDFLRFLLGTSFLFRAAAERTTRSPCLFVSEWILFEIDFPPAAIYSRRSLERDLLEMSEFPGVTIDSDHSRDLDDSLWVEPLQDGVKVTVCISDVSASVEQGSDTDRTACAAGFTRYSGSGPNRPMLPPEMSEAALSLLPGAVRRVVAFTVTLGADLSVADVDVSRGFLRNEGRLSHEGASALMDTDAGQLGGILRLAWQVASGLLDKRRLAGAIAFFSPGTGLATDEDGNLISVGTGSSSRAHVIVQELMILVNSAVSADMAARGVPLLYRNHRGNPFSDRDALSHDTEIAAFGGRHAAAAAARLTMMAGRATLGSRAVGHFGLNLPVYAWFTSPIRRYADLVNHRILAADLDGRPPPYSQDELEVIGTALTRLAAEDADQRSAAMKQGAENRASGVIRREDFASQDQAGFRAVIKAAVEKGVFPPSLLAETVVRMSAGLLADKEMGRILLSENPVMRPAKEAVLEHLRTASREALAVIHYLSQGVLTDLNWSTGKEGPDHWPVFRCTVSALCGRTQHRVTGDPSDGSVDAKQNAAVALLAGLAGIPLPSVTGGEEARPVQTSAVLPVVTFQPVGNPKGDLIELCTRMKIAPAVLEMTSTGPAHAPVFSGSGTVVMVCGTVSSSVFGGHTRKDVERAVCADLLSKLSADPPPAKPVAENPKNDLLEACRSLRLPAPVYDVVQSGPLHAPVFAVTARLGTCSEPDRSGSGSAPSKKQAEQRAAAALLKKLKSVPSEALSV